MCLSDLIRKLHLSAFADHDTNVYCRGIGDYNVRILAKGQDSGGRSGFWLTVANDFFFLA